MFRIVRSQSGLSLIEILISLTLIALAGAFVTKKVFESYEEGRVNVTKIRIQQISQAMANFRRHCNFYPMTDQGLQGLVSKPGGRECKRYQGSGYLEKVPDDPWDNPFEYESDGRKYKIYSLGGDGMEGGEGYDADISSDDI